MGLKSRRASTSFILTLVVVISTAACTSSPAGPTEPTVVTLAPGASGSAGGLKVTFVRVTADSRCPGDALCIQAGDAQVAIETAVFGVKQSAELYLVDPAKRRVTHGHYTVVFETLSPYPFLSRGPIAPGAYRATFRIAAK